MVEHKNYEEAKIAVHQAFEYIVNHAAELDVDADRLGIIGFLQEAKLPLRIVTKN